MKAAGETLSPALRKRLIAVRTALVQRGIYDPVLARLDSATAPQASIAELVEQLARVASNLA